MYMFCFTLSNFLFKFFILSSKSVFFTKLAIYLLLAKFASANLAVNSSNINFWDSWVVMYLAWSWSVNFLFSAVKLLNAGVAIYILCSYILLSIAARVVVVPKLVILGISFLTSFNLGLKATVVAKLGILGISFLTSFILSLRVILLAKLVISGI